MSQTYSGLLTVPQLQSLQISAVEYLERCHVRVEVLLGAEAGPHERIRTPALRIDWEESIIHTAVLLDSQGRTTEAHFSMVGRNDKSLTFARLGEDDKLRGWQIAQNVTISAELYACFLICIHSCVVQRRPETGIKVRQSQAELSHLSLLFVTGTEPHV